jgi:putative ABC transport system permease protein
MWRWRKRTDEDFSEEIQANIALDIDRLMAEGMSPDDARTAALRAFGNITRAQERFYESRRVMWLDDLRRDMRYALRSLSKTPGFTAVAVLTLALGIGATTAIFSIVNAVLIRSLPFERADQLYKISRRSAEQISQWISVPEFIEWQEQNRAFSRLAGFTHMDFNIRGQRPESVLAVWASQDFLNVLGVKPHLGRPFRTEEFQPTADRVTVIGHQLWQRRFGGDPDIVGKAIDLDGPQFLSDSSGRYTIIGVLPASFWLFHPRGAEVVVPMRASSNQMADRKQRLVESVIGRLTDSTPEQAVTHITAIARRFDSGLPSYANDRSTIEVVGLHESHMGDWRRPLLLLLGATVLVALIACMNVTLLLLARGNERQREFAIRTSLGAGRVRLMRQLLTETVLLSAMGGLLGLLIAVLGIDLLTLLIPSQLLNRIPAGAESISFDDRVLTVAAIGVALAGILTGLVPALRASRAGLSQTFAAATGGWVRDRRLTLQGSLVIVQTALAIILLFAATLLLKTLGNLQRVDLGLTPNSDLVVWLNLNPSRYPSDADKVRFYNQVIEQLQMQPEIGAVSGVDLPFLFDWQIVRFSVDSGQTADVTRWPQALDRAVTATYFDRHGIRLVRGRWFREVDDSRAPQVAIVSQTLAQRFWPKSDPVGQQLSLHAGSNNESATIIGVVTDILHSPNAQPQPIIYRSFKQHPPPWMYFTVEGSTPTIALLEPIRRAVWAVDPDQPLDGPEGPWTLANWISDEIAQPRLIAVLMNVFALVALALAIIGLYGTLAYSVTQRTREIGIRMALGAKRSQVIGLVVSQGAALTAIGIVLGLAGAGAITRYLEGLLFGVTPHDPATFITVGLIFASVTIFAAFVPARRATKVDPMVALRCE